MSRLSHSARAALLMAGGSAAALGLSVLVGWYARSAVLVQVRPGLPPMQFNTALGFLLIGAGLLAVAFRRPTVALACATVPAAFGVLTLAQYLLTVGLGIDTLLFEPDITVATSHPGRMPALTAACLVLTSGAVAALSGRLKRRRRLEIVGALGSVIAVVGLVVLSAYLSRLSAEYLFGPYSSMAVHTAGGFAVVGTGLVAFVWGESTVRGVEPPRWLPGPVAIGLLTVTLLLWRGLTLAERAYIEQTVQLALEDVRSQITVEMETRTESLIRMAKRWEHSARLEEEWDFEAHLYRGDYPNLRAVAWADSSLRLRRIAPLDGDEATQNLYLGFEERRRTAVQVAQARGEARASRSFDLVEGGKGLLLVVPIDRTLASSGLLVAVFEMQGLLDAMLANVATSYAVAVSDSRDEVYRRGDPGHRRDWGQEIGIDVYGVEWAVEVWPSPGVVSAARTALPTAVLTFGALLSILMASTLGFAQQSRIRAREVAAANRELAEEVVERKNAEVEVRLLSEDLERRVVARTAELAAANQELEAFTYSVSHDLRAPLRQVDGFAKLLEEQLPGLDATAEHYLRRVQQGAHQMGRLIDDLLGLSRVARTELYPRLTELNALVDDAIAALESDSVGRAIEWRVGRLSPAVCDPGLMTLVFANLLSNAVKFTGPRERAVIELGQIGLAGEPTVFVRDNGVGFDMKYADKLFGVFQRLHRAEEFAGTGVGLATVQRIIHRHGGRVWAEAELDQGATFFFTLGMPRCTDTAADAAAGGTDGVS